MMPTILFYVNGVAGRFPRALAVGHAAGRARRAAEHGHADLRHGRAVVGDAIAIGLGSLAPADLLFGGEIQNLEATYQADARNLGLREWPVDLIDHSFALNKRRPFVSFVNESATTAAQHLVATYAPASRPRTCRPGLPTLTINFDGSQTLLECLNAIAQAIGGRTKVDYSRDVHLFLPPEPGLVMPDPITLDNPPLNSPPIRFTVDLSQCRTRVYGKGHGETIPSDISDRRNDSARREHRVFQCGGRARDREPDLGRRADAATDVCGRPGRAASGRSSDRGAAPSAQPTATRVPGSGLLNASLLLRVTPGSQRSAKRCRVPIAIVCCGPLAESDVASDTESRRSAARARMPACIITACRLWPAAAKRWR